MTSKYFFLVVLVLCITFLFTISIQWLPQHFQKQLQNSSQEPAKKECNPFDKGYIHKHSWVSLDPLCDEKDYNILRLVKTSQPQNLTWLQNKTILLIGDSMERFAVDAFCKEAGWDRYTGKYPSESGQDFVECSTWDGCPHICHSKTFNTLILNAFTVSLRPGDRIKENSHHHIPSYQPYDPVERIQHVYMSYITKSLKRFPDIVVFNSGLWDLLSWSRNAIYEGKGEPNMDILSPQLLKNYTDSIANYTTSLQSIFNTSSLYWRNLIEMPLTTSNWQVEDLPAYQKEFKANVFRNTYIDSLNLVTKDMFSAKFPNLKILDWYKVTHGDLEFRDGIHPKDEGFLPLLNMVLYELKYELPRVKKE